MKAPGPNCPALAIWKAGDGEVLACVDQGCCGWDQHKALLPQVGSAGCKEHLSSAQHSRFGAGGFVQPSSLPKPLQRIGRLLVPPAFWLYNMEHIFCLCAAGL